MDLDGLEGSIAFLVIAAVVLLLLVHQTSEAQALRRNPRDLRAAWPFVVVLLFLCVKACALLAR